MRPLHIAVAFVLCGCASRAPSTRDHAEPSDAGTRPVNIASIGGKSLGALTPSQSEALCRADAERFDPCVDDGIISATQADCMQTVDACHAAVGDASKEFDCRRYDLGDDCNVSVDEYLACVDAWNAVYTCQNAGQYIATPKACEPVVAGCPRFGRIFYRDGKPPACDPSTASKPPRDGCRPPPARFVILGDSIASCLAVSHDECGPLLIAQHVEETVAPELVIEQHAVAGAVIADMPGQAAMVAGGPGHVAVWIHILGNDLALRHDDEPGWNAAFDTTFAYFTDRSRFPDGATFLLNTQYSPYDRCPDPTGGGFSISLSSEDGLENINKTLFIGFGDTRPDTITYDEHADWLGHGNNANVLGCPFCGADDTSWMSPDRIHPNAIGYAHVAAKWDAELDRMYGPNCGAGPDE
jgi:hypothetical protein